MMHKRTLISNVQVFTRDGFVPGVLAVEGETIKALLPINEICENCETPLSINENCDINEMGALATKFANRVYPCNFVDFVDFVDAEVVDGQGAYCLPGFIDLHFHGCAGYDVCDGSSEALQTIADYELSVGVTSICPATMTLPLTELEQVLRTAAAFRDGQSHGAALVGLNMEGPFISAAKKGAQREDCILPATAEAFDRLYSAADGLLKIMGVAPEASDYRAFLRRAGDCCSVSLAHSNADYDTAAAAFDAGAEHVTHLYNAMPSLHHREPGLIAAAAEREKVTAELICDGVHIHPAMVRMAYRLFGPERLILISDSIRATGMADGNYPLGGQTVTVSGKQASLSDGTLAGSVTTLPDCVRTAVREMGITLHTAVRCATVNPAKRLGLNHIGTLEPGAQADLVLWDQHLNLTAVMQKGQWITKED